MKKSDLITVILFSGLIFTVFVANIINPDKSFSEIENRVLESYPTVSVSNLLSGKLSTDFENYVTDQFVFRNEFIELKSNVEFLMGKQENNNVFFTSNDTLIERFDEPDFDLIDRSIRGIKELKEKIEIPVYTTIIPTQIEVLKDTLPVNAPSYMQDRMISYVYGQLNDVIDMSEVLEVNKNKYIFYGTDHHWTSLGAYYGYTAIAERLNKEIISLENYQEKVITTEFNGTIFNKSGIRKAKSDSISIYVENQEITINDGLEDSVAMLYNEEFLDKGDKYAIFLGGNDPIVRIEGKGEGNILFIKDSYTNSMVPFFIEQYENIHLIDLRYMRGDVSEYIMDKGIDEVVICYSAGNFAEDKNIQLIK